MYFQVIMPIGSDAEFAEKQRIIAEAASNYELIPRFPPEPSVPRPLNLSDIAEISDSAFVVADLSFERPSCYFELGLAEGLGKKIFIVARRGTTIHQTPAGEAIAFYSDLDEFRRVIDTILRSIRPNGATSAELVSKSSR